LARSVAEAAGGAVVAGPMATENIGVEKLVRNVLAHPFIGSVVLCGPETGGAAPTGHYAGDALLCLHRHGVEPGTRRIVGARGRRPYVRNLLPAEIAAFRARVRVVDLRGETDVGRIGETVGEEAARYGEARSPGGTTGRREPIVPAEGTIPAASVPRAGLEVVEAALPARYVPDPAGYLLIFVDRTERRLLLEHYSNEGRRSSILAGTDPRALAASAVERGLVSRLDHAAYLGRELTRAADALERGEAYVQDAAPEAQA
jgi:tetrahydromethanopterin S-methyltransferase subunit A